MFRHFHLTRRQWLGLLRWGLYALLFLLTVVFQSVVLARLPVFGAKLTVIPTLLCCICIREGSEKGGLFVLLASLFWGLSGVDYGNLSIFLLPALCILFSELCSRLLSDRFFSVWICCLLTVLLHESVLFVFKLLLTNIAPTSYWEILLPGVAFSLLLYPLYYLLVKLISRIGGDYGV